MGQIPTEPQLLPLAALSLPRSFSSMSDITGKGPRAPHGEGSSGGNFSAHLRPMLPALPVACVSLPEAQLCPGQAGRLCSGGLWGSWFTLSLVLALAVLCGAPPPFWSTLRPLLGNYRVTLAGLAWP